MLYRQLHTFCLLWPETAEKLQKRAEFEKSVLLVKLTVRGHCWWKKCTRTLRVARFFSRKYFLFFQAERRKCKPAIRRRFDLPPSTSPPTLGGATLHYTDIAAKCSTSEITLQYYSLVYRTITTITVFSSRFFTALKNSIFSWYWGFWPICVSYRI